MTRRTLLRIAVSAILALLSLPAAAIAGTYSWDMPANFTLSGGGSNPDHDAYGAKPWSYSQSLGALVLPPTHSSLTPLHAFSASTRGGLAGWTGTGSALVAGNPTSRSLSDGLGDTFPARTLVMTPPSNGLVAVGWKSPLSHVATISISGSVGGADRTPCFIWSLDRNGSTLAGKSGSGAGSFSASTSVQPGDRIALTVTRAVDSLVSNPECGTAVVTLRIADTAAGRPSVSLTSPVGGAIIGAGRPTFSGGASTEFGASPAVTVRVFSGASASGTPVQTLGTTRSGAGFSVASSAPLRDGTYTAQAEQDDLSSPADRGFSSAVTFAVRNGVPAGRAIGATVTLSRRSGAVVVPVSCVASAGAPCTGEVLVLTVKSMRTLAGGPYGPVRVLFAHVTIPAGHTIKVRRTLPGYVVRALRHPRSVSVHVRVELSRTGRASATRTLIVGR